MLRTVLAHAERRDIPRAAAIAEEALSSGFEHPLLLNVVATRLELDGKLEDALQLLERASRLAPDDIGVRNALSLCLQRLGRPGEALRHVDKLLNAHPGLGFAHANKGNALIALGALDKAKQSHLQALELDPGNLAAQGALASIATHRGDHDEARAWARKVLSKVPGFPDAVLSLAAAELAGGSTDSAQMLICQLLADPRAGPAEKARANGLLGDVLDAAGRCTEAFDAYAACNESLLQVHRRFAEGSSILSYAESVIAAMLQVEPRRWTPGPPPCLSAAGTIGHVFLLSFPCSGTTLLEVALEGHPRIASIDAEELLGPGVLRFMPEPLDFAPLLRADEAVLQELRAAYWRQARDSGTELDGKVFVDKHPLNTLKLPLIARLFPNAKILFACRDPRDVVLSCFRRRFNMNPAVYQLLTLDGGAAFYDAAMRLAGQARPLLGLDWQVVRYENLLENPAQQLQAVCDFLGLEWVQDLDNVAARGLESSGIGQWHHYRAALEPILPVLSPWVQRFGYGA